MEADLRTLETSVKQFVEDALRVILFARLQNSQWSQNRHQFEKRLHFPVGELPEDEILEQWRANPNRPLFLKCFLSWTSPSSDEPDGSTVKDSVPLELWTLDFKSRPPESSSRSSLSQPDDLTALHRKMVVLTKVLYCQLRLLPTNRLHHTLITDAPDSFTLNYELSLDTPPCDESWDRMKDVVYLDVPNGLIKITVQYNQHESLINELCPRQESGEIQEKQELDNEVLEDWVLFTESDRRDSLLDPSRNQIAAHFRNSLLSVKSVVSLFTSRNATGSQEPIPVKEAKEASLEEDVMEFLKELQEMKPLDCTQAKHVNLTYEMRCILLSKYL